MRRQGGEAERGRGDRDDMRGGQGEARGDEGRSCPEKATGTGTVCGTADVEA